MRRKNTKGRRPFRATFGALLLLVGAGSLLYFFHPAVLTAAGRYLAPEGAGKADVVILEGGELVKEKAVKIGMGLISSGRASGLVVVYQDSENEKAFGKPADYTNFLMEKIGDLGLKKDQIKILPVPQEHPITLNEARVVLSHLSRYKIQSAILITEDFHSRRSYWVYKKVGTPLRIEIIPYPYFPRFEVDGWWQHARGVRNFAAESMKFFYYLLRGYLPLKSLVMI